MLFLSKDISDCITHKIDMRDDRPSRADRLVAVSGQHLGIAPIRYPRILCLKSIFLLGTPT